MYNKWKEQYYKEADECAVKAQTSLAPLSWVHGSRVTTAHAHQCCIFQSYAKTVPSRMKLTMREPAFMTTAKWSRRVTSDLNSVVTIGTRGWVFFSAMQADSTWWWNKDFIIISENFFTRSIMNITILLYMYYIFNSAFWILVWECPALVEPEKPSKRSLPDLRGNETGGYYFCLLKQPLTKLLEGGAKSKQKPSLPRRYEKERKT